LIVPVKVAVEEWLRTAAIRIPDLSASAALRIGEPAGTSMVYPDWKMGTKKIADVGGALVKRQEHHVARAGLDASHGLGRGPMLDQDRLNPNAFCKRTSDIDPHAPELTGCRVLGVLSRKQPYPDFAGLHEVGNPKVV
jgi:hypothetical protein